MLASEWKSQFPESNLDAFFLDQYFEQQYTSNKHFARIMGLFSAIALLIALLGLAALANFSAQKKLRDIAIRKIYGAERRHIIYLFAKEFLRTASIASAIAIPIAAIAMQQWLNGFAFRTSIGIWIYLLAIGCLVGISLATIILQSWKVIVQNPIENLKNP
ncbi:FtsX-like permease family protein [Olivibacter sitiensis]|uniref:FtsX-like permease family protein n=1 Tax=Olivibacter sitiensis TaxID=376470 RepID=UPI001B7FB4E6|nr:FtsX-like permease family protein [Olivibacter sitiensis]